MNKAVELFKKARVFFLATNEGDQPRVRPFGAVAEINGKLYICTGNNKDCFKQMIETPKVELAGMLNETDWVRLCGTIQRDENLTVKEEFLKQSPVPGHTADDGVFEVFYFTEGIVKVYPLYTSNPECFDLYD